MCIPASDDVLALNASTRACCALVMLELYTGAPTSKVPLALIRIPVNSVVV